LENSCAIRHPCGLVESGARRCLCACGKPFPKNVTEIQALNFLKDWVEAHDLGRIVMATPSVGPVRDSLRAFFQWCGECGIVVTLIRRRWDARVFPLAKAGFFPFWNSVRPQLSELIL
jgi:hypothetical protein